MLNPPENLQAIVKTYRPIAELIPTHWTEGDIIANNIRQHYYRTGGHSPSTNGHSLSTCGEGWGEAKKPPLLLLHGFNEYGLTWLRVARELEQNYDIIMLDARGHGHSDGIATGFSTSLLVEDVAAAIHALKLDRPPIIGLSRGGTTVLHLAATYPHLVSSFIFEGWGDENQSTSFRNSEGYLTWYNSWIVWLEQLRTLNHQERMLSALPQLLPAMPNSIWPEIEYVPLVEAYSLFDLNLARSSMQLWSNSEKDDPNELLQRVTCPALIMKHAWVIPSPGSHAVREIPSQQPYINIVYFDNTGHLIRRQAFEQYMTLVREFLILSSS